MVCDPASTETFMKDSISWMRNQPYIARWAWEGAFTNMGTANLVTSADQPANPASGPDSNQLVNSDGSPNALGQTYVKL